MLRRVRERKKEREKERIWRKRHEQKFKAKFDEGFKLQQNNVDQTVWSEPKKVAVCSPKKSMRCDDLVRWQLNTCKYFN